MKIYKCDSCGMEFNEPYTQKMKEFCLSTEIDEYGIFPKNWIRKTKVHLCNRCFAGLYILHKKKCSEMVHTNDILIRNNEKYEVVIADDNIFVICPIFYDEVEQSDVVKYDKAEIYANQSSINTLEELGFIKWK